MPQIIIEADAAERGSGSSVVHRERISPADLQTDTSSQLLIERIGWAVHDADQLEHPEDTEELRSV